LKYIFDKKPTICDISSKALTLIYQIGDADVKESLVQSLSQILAGDEKTQQTVGGETNDDKDEDRELLLDLHNQSSTEQRKKMKTYKDLCKIAVEIGHKEMIYQFMEVHRHLTHY
jgi:proteasome component ECM29